MPMLPCNTQLNRQRRFGTPRFPCLVLLPPVVRLIKHKEEEGGKAWGTTNNRVNDNQVTQPLHSYNSIEVYTYIHTLKRSKLVWQRDSSRRLLLCPRPQFKHCDTEYLHALWLFGIRRKDKTPFLYAGHTVFNSSTAPQQCFGLTDQQHFGVKICTWHEMHGRALCMRWYARYRTPVAHLHTCLRRGLTTDSSERPAVVARELASHSC